VTGLIKYGQIKFIAVQRILDAQYLYKSSVALCCAQYAACLCAQGLRSFLTDETIYLSAQGKAKFVRPTAVCAESLSSARSNHTWSIS
jgi:hypothetical protein